MSDEEINHWKIEREVINIIQRFYHALDQRSYEACIDCFFEDGYWSRMGEDLNGLPAIRQALGKRNPNLAIRHVLSNVFASDITESTALVQSYVSVYLHLFEDEVVVPAPLREPKSIWSLSTQLECRGGKWAIARHDGELVMTRS